MSTEAGRAVIVRNTAVCLLGLLILSACMKPRAAGLPQTPKASALYSRGTQLLNQGSCELAAAELAQAARIEPTSASVQLNLGSSFFCARQFADAVQALRQSSTINPDHAMTRFALANALFAMQEFSSAAREYGKGVELIGNVSSAMPLPILQALALERSGRVDETRRLLEHWTRSGFLIGATGAPMAVGGALGGWDKTAAQYLMGQKGEETVLETAPKEKVAFAYFFIGVHNVSSGDSDRASKYLDRTMQALSREDWLYVLAEAESVALDR